jgi:spermidine synthase
MLSTEYFKGMFFMNNSPIHNQDTESTGMDLWVSERNHGTSFGFKIKRVLHSEKSNFQQVDILETDTYGNLMLLDGLVMTTERDEYVYHEMISHVPLCSLPHPPERVLIIGGGDGGTLREVLRHSSVKEAVLCEIDGAVIEAGRNYFPTIGCAFDDPRATVLVADGVDYMAKAEPESFDVILVDSTDPVGPGVGLFTQDFYNNAKRALKLNGILTAQTESPFSDHVGMSRIYDVLHDVFDHVTGYYGVIPTYPGHLWTWSFCTKSGDVTPWSHVKPATIKALDPTGENPLKYYNFTLHHGAFMHPTVVQSAMRPSIQQF